MKSILQKWAACFLALSMLITLVPLSAMPASAAELSGAGTETDPFLIGTLTDLEAFRNEVNGGETYEGKLIKLTADIDMGEKYGAEKGSWTPIGYYDPSSEDYDPSLKILFKGTFDGDRHRISGLYINSEGKYQGLFSRIEKGGTVKNLTVSGDVTGSEYVGIVAGTSSGTIERVITEGSARGTVYVGGIAGDIYLGKTENCKNFAIVEGNTVVGGVAGDIQSDPSSSSAIIRCANMGKVTGNKDEVGGVVGACSGEVSECYNTGEVGGTRHVGGIVGKIGAGSVSDCYNTGKVSGTNCIGGICGGEVFGKTENVYHFGTVDAGGASDCGAIVGDLDADLSNAYYLAGSLTGGTNYGTALTAEDFKDEAKFAGFVFDSVWEMDSSYKRPILAANPEGVRENPYIISSLEDLKAFRDSVNAGNDYKGQYVKVVADRVGVSEKDADRGEYIGWKPIGSFTYAADGITIENEKPFNGTFDGGGHTISAHDSAYKDSGSPDYRGLFGCIGESGTVKNLTVTAMDFEAAKYVGLVAVLNKGTVENITARSNWGISAKGNAGGIVGENRGTIRDCTAETEISAGYETDTYGGIAGKNFGGQIIRCKNISTVNYNENVSSNVGGICGLSENDGEKTAVIQECYNSSKVYGESNVGGICGKASGTIISDCYNTGLVVANAANAGGICGETAESTSVSSVYNYGTVSAPASLGAIYGEKDGTSAVTNAYYLDGSAAGGASQDGAIALSENNFSNKDNFGGFDFEDAWVMNIYLGRPILRSAPELNSGTEEGTADDPYRISNVDDLRSFRDTVNGGNSFEGKFVRLTADIVAGDFETPIGNSGSQFKGTFDGGDHSIFNLFFDGKSASNYLGLFGCIGNGGTVKNLTVWSNGSHVGKNYIGIVAGRNEGTIENVTARGVVTGELYVGGIAGNSFCGTIKNCRSFATVKGNENVGGIAGCIIATTVKESEITGCYNMGNIIGKSITETLSDGMTDPDGNTPRVKESSHVGGIVGNCGSYTKVALSYNAGAVSGDDSVGGVVGHSSGSVSDCYNIGSVTGTERAVGGICGRQVNDQSGIKNVYNYGTVDAQGATDVGAICGFFFNSNVAGAYYLNTGVASDHSTALSEEDFSDRGKFVGFDFGRTWEMNTDFERPVLTANKENRGAKNNPILIYTLEEFKAFRDSVNSGDSHENIFIKLMADIDLRGESWEPIGHYIDNPRQDTYFGGTFDGNGHKITGLYINNNEERQGLFGLTTYRAVIRNLSVSGDVKGEQHVGIVVGMNNGTVENVAAYGTVNGDGDVGGIAGYNNVTNYEDGVIPGVISKCANFAAVNGRYFVGGICGANTSLAEIRDCYNTAAVTADGFGVGGICGNNNSSGKIQNCHNTAAVTANENVGGICGDNDGGLVETCYYLADGGLGDASATGLTAAQFADKGSFAGWDFTSVWEMPEDGTYPVLRGITEPLGSASNPYLIESLEDLEALRDSVNNGEAYKGKYFRLTNDIDMSGKYGEGNASWTPIGKDKANPFSGTFNGGGHTISGLYINVGLKDSQGLFGRIDGGTVKNLTVSGSVTSSGQFVGLVVGSNSGTAEVENVHADGYVEGQSQVGLIAGQNYGIISRCSSAGKFFAGSGNKAGGICGSNYNDGKIEYCRNAALYDDKDNDNGNKAAGICGFNARGTISSCYNTAELSANIAAAGICYDNQGTISNCYNIAALSAKEKVSGICTYNNGATVENCYQYGTLKGDEASPIISVDYGGTVTNSYYNSDLFVGDGTTAYQGTPLAAADFDKTAGFEGWDFTNVWMLDGNAPRPVLKNNVEEIGSKTNPYMIKTAEKLKEFRESVNGGESFEGKFVALGDNIDISEVTNWTPIGNGSKPFKGSFDGQGYEIQGLTISDSGVSSYSGLFGFIGEGAAVKNLTVSGSVTSKASFSGGVSGMNYGTIENVVNKVKVNNTYIGAGHTAGGIAGGNQGKIINCTNEANITGTAESVGGIAGYNTSSGDSKRGSIEYCKNTGDIQTTNSEGYAGGIAGQNLAYATVNDVYSTGTVNGTISGGLVGEIDGLDVKLSNGYYDSDKFGGEAYGEKDIFGGGKVENVAGKPTAAFASGEVAHLLQSVHGDDLVWGQNLSGTTTTLPEHTGDIAKKVLKLTLMKEDSTAEGGYSEHKALYANYNQTISLGGHDAPNTETEFFLWWRNGHDGGTYTFKNNEQPYDKDYTLYPEMVDYLTFTVTGTNQVYKAETPRTVKVQPNRGAPPLKVSYYEVDENSGKLKSTTPVEKAIASGKYLYVISLDETAMTESDKREYRIKRAFNVENTDLPADDAYDNIGYMYISATAEQQSPIYFADSVVNVYRTDSVSNPLEGVGNNPGATVTYESRNTSVAEVDGAGRVTLNGAGTAVIIATSKKEGCADVYASYTLNVTKEVVTVTVKDVTMHYGDSFTGGGYTLSKAIDAAITGDAVYTTSYRTGDGIGKYDINIGGLSSALYELVFVPGKLTVSPKVLNAGDFTITAKDKTYDGTANAELNITANDGVIVSGDAVSLIASGTFDNANAGDSKAVTYSATGLSGANSANYKLEGGGFNGSTSANIAQAEVTVSVPAVTTNVYDGEPKSVNAFAYANGRYFDKFDITYGGSKTAPSDVGEYAIGIELTDANYKLADTVSAKLIIRSAQQDFFSIEGVPQSVVYGSTFTLQAAGTDGAVTYEITEGADLVTLAGDVITAKGVGTVTVKATSQKGNFADKTAQKTFVIGKRTVTAMAAAASKTYDGTVFIGANIALIGTLDSDTVSAKYASAYTLTPDAEDGKTVFVTGIYLDGADSGKYQLLSNSVQTIADITKKEITAAEITASDKVYDKNANAAYIVTNLDGIVGVDKDFVTLSGTAEFEDANAGENKTVTLTNYSLIGTKSANYVLASNFAAPQTTAKIEQATVDFTVGTLEYVYDGKAKSVPITASVNGVPFTDFKVTYDGSETAPTDKKDYAVAITLNDSTNYKTDFGGATLRILTADQNSISITGLVGTIDYGKEFTLSAQGGSGTGAVTWQSSNTAIAEVSAAGLVTVKGTDAEVTITATKAADGNYGAQSASVTFTPVKKAVSFKLSGLNHTYDGSAKAVSVTDGTGENKYNVTYADENGTAVTAPAKAGTYYVTVTATGHYEGSTSGIMTVKNANIAASGITFNVGNTTYGTPISVTMPDSASYPAGVSAKVTYTGSGIYEPTEEMPTDAGKYMATLTLSGENYNETKLTRSFVIEKAVITARPKAAARKYGEPNPIFEMEYFDQNNNAVDKSNITIEPTAYTEANISTATGAYDIIASGGYADNYTFSYETGTLTIGEASGGSFHIMGGQTNPYVGAAFTLSAYYNNEKAEVSWSSSNTDVATVDANGVVTVRKDGTATITAKMTDSRFDKNLTAQFNLTAQYAPETQQQIYFDEPLVEKCVTDGQFTAVLSGLSDGATVKYKSSKPEVAAVDEATGKVTIKKVGTTVITATATKFNCPDVQATYTLTVKKYPVTVKADTIGLTYGDTFGGTTVTYSDGLSASDFGGTLGFTTRYSAGKGVGEYDVTPTGLTSDIYDITYESGTITVSEKVLSADDFVVSAQDKTYDETTSAGVTAAVKANSLVGADRIAAVVSGAFDDENAGENKTVSYTISDISGRGFENYKLDGGAISGTTTANISKAKVTFFVSENTVRSYDGRAKKVEISAMALGDVFRESGYTVWYTLKDGGDAVAEPIHTGIYTVSVELADEYGANFEAVQPEATLEITVDDTAVLRITGSGKNVTVGDVFTLYAQYGNHNPNVRWQSSNADVAEISDSGEVKILNSGSATITATLDDSNYGTGSATFDLEASKKQISLKIPASELVKTYNGEVQNIAFANVPNGADVTASYVKIDDSSVTEPKNAGTYSVSYELIDDRYEASGNTTLTINKAKVTVEPKDITKIYGSEPSFELEVVSGSEIAAADEFANIAEFASDGADTKAKVGEYDITLTLTLGGDENRIFEVGAGKGKLTVKKAPLTIKVKDVTREYGAENPTLEAEFTGFVNGETKDVLTGELILAYADTINAETEVGIYTNAATASGLASDNYEITFASGNVEVTKIKVTASAGTSRSGYLTVKLDKPIAGLTADNFEVKNGESIIGLTSVTASGGNKTYTLNGSFTVGTAYTVTPKITSETHEIISAPLTITPSRSNSGGGGGGGGGSSAAATTYTVAFETNGGSKVTSVKVTKNETVKAPAEPTRDNFKFEGWYSDKDLTEAYDFSAKVTKSITLYAKWSEKQTQPTDPTNPSETKWENPFTDVREDDWFYNNVKFAVQNKLFGGTTATTFEPDTPVTRGMVVTVLYRAEGEPEVNKSIPFADIAASDYFANAVIWAEQNGIVTGTSETSFAPNDNITREQLAAIILRFAMHKGYDVSVGENTNLLSYDDFDDISEYAIPAMQYAAGFGLINGKSESTLNPKDGATRAEAAAILQRFIEGNR